MAKIDYRDHLDKIAIALESIAEALENQEKENQEKENWCTEKLCEIRDTLFDAIGETGAWSANKIKSKIDEILTKAMT